LNLLSMPGVTDREEEVAALLAFLTATKVNQVQFRNLNLDPDHYLAVQPRAQGEIIGMVALAESVQALGVSVR
ncbi:MAG: radical SAM protein, partial [Thermaerobacter sp.]|nr:radical SAM protein [Thermaerobacter sp.]